MTRVRTCSLIPHFMLSIYSLRGETLHYEPAVQSHISCSESLYLHYIRETTPMPLPPDETRPGSLTVQRPHTPPFTPTTLLFSHPPTYCSHTPWPPCVSCSCPCPALASTRCRRARHVARGGWPVGGHGDVLAGGHHGP